MIITESKPLEEILKSLSGNASVFIAGCAACASKCGTGDEKAVAALADSLAKAGKRVTGSGILDTPCDMRVAKKDLSANPRALEADAIVVLGCGAGIQSIEKVLDKPLVPGLNPLFTGSTERIGLYHEFCKVCGECVLTKTGGICPVTRCAKSLANGPCGGAVKGKCEVDPDQDCAWILIYKKLEEKHLPKDILSSYQQPRSNAKPVKINRTRKL